MRPESAGAYEVWRKTMASGVQNALRAFIAALIVPSSR